MSPELQPPLSLLTGSSTTPVPITTNSAPQKYPLTGYKHRIFYPSGAWLEPVSSSSVSTASLSSPFSSSYPLQDFTFQDNSIWKDIDFGEDTEVSNADLHALELDYQQEHFEKVQRSETIQLHSDQEPSTNEVGMKTVLDTSTKLCPVSLNHQRAALDQLSASRRKKKNAADTTELEPLIATNHTSPSNEMTAHAQRSQTAVTVQSKTTMKPTGTNTQQHHSISPSQQKAHQKPLATYFRSTNTLHKGPTLNSKKATRATSQTAPSTDNHRHSSVDQKKSASGSQPAKITPPTHYVKYMQPTKQKETPARTIVESHSKGNQNQHVSRKSAAASKPSYSKPPKKNVSPEDNRQHSICLDDVAKGIKIDEAKSKEILRSLMSATEADKTLEECSISVELSLDGQSMILNSESYTKEIVEAASQTATRYTVEMSSQTEEIMNVLQVDTGTQMEELRREEKIMQTFDEEKSVELQQVLRVITFDEDPAHRTRSSCLHQTDLFVTLEPLSAAQIGDVWLNNGVDTSETTRNKAPDGVKVQSIEGWIRSMQRSSLIEGGLPSKDETGTSISRDYAAVLALTLLREEGEIGSKEQNSQGSTISGQQKGSNHTEEDHGAEVLRKRIAEECSKTMTKSSPLTTKGKQDGKVSCHVQVPREIMAILGEDEYSDKRTSSRTKQKVDYREFGRRPLRVVGDGHSSISSTKLVDANLRKRTRESSCSSAVTKVNTYERPNKRARR